MKHLILVGLVGCGKSSLANSLLNMNQFTVGHIRTVSVTNYFQIGSNEDFYIIDSPPFNDILYFGDMYLSERDKFLKLSSINAIILVHKINCSNMELLLDSAECFLSAFGNTGLKSLILLCIQNNYKEIILSEDEFYEKLIKSDGYRYLLSKNNGKNIPFVLWDNISEHVYPNQKENLHKCIDSVKEFNKRDILFSFDLFEKRINIAKLFMMKNKLSDENFKFIFNFENDLESTKIIRRIENSKVNNLILVGQLGNGKSTTANFLLQGNFFDTGCSLNSITKNFSIFESDNIRIIDCPGFGDLYDESIFFKKFLENKDALLKYGDYGLILVVKFYDYSSDGFLLAAKDFLSVFGCNGLQSLIIFCIQSGKIRFSNSHFERIINESSGYNYLLHKNNKRKIPYVLWDNFKPYPNQVDQLFSCLDLINKFDSGQMQLSFKLVQNHVSQLYLEEKLRRSNIDKSEKRNNCFLM